MPDLESSPLLHGGARPASLVAGEWVDGGDSLVVEDPARAQEIARVATAGPDLVAAAVDAAGAAWPAWRATSAAERSRSLWSVADRLEQLLEPIAATLTREVGKPIAQSRSDVRTAAAHFRFFAGVVDKVGGSEIPTDASHLVFTTYEPIGVTAHISPWNSPIGIPARSIAAALAMGNTVVFKPSELAPLSGLNLAGALLSDSMPPGAFNLVIGEADVGRALVEQPAVRSVTFTGSTTIGAEIRRASAARMARLSLELGGKAAIIVRADADVDAAAADVGRALIRTSGQTCLSPARLFVHRQRYEEVVERLIAFLGSITIGDGSEGAEMGPLISRARLAAVENVIHTARDAASPLFVGSLEALPADLHAGYFCAPAVFGDVPPHSALDQDEVFGPVLAVYPFDEDDEAIDRANDVPLGLSGGVWTSDLDAAIRIARGLEVGSVSVNGYPLRFPHGPHGGYKASGMGREQGLEAVRNYVEVKRISVRLRG